MMVQFDVKRVQKGTESFMVSFDFTKTPVTQIADYIIIAASKYGASDIHFDPREDGMMVRFRIDGDCQDYTFVPLAYEKNLTTRLKLLANMNITESRLPQDGAIKGTFGDQYLDMRVSSLPLNEGEKVVIRILDYSRSLEGIDTLGFHPKNLEKIKRMMELPNGIILTTGATGSGKSTTTYSILQGLNKPETNIITVEDPIEMNIEGINQVQVNAEIGMTFAAALRSILRQDPNIILIGEIRDSETAQIAVRASITGHLVLSTIHTNNALATVERLLDMEVERYLLATSLTGIISQRLAKMLCPDCRYQRETTKYEKKVFKKFMNMDVATVWEANPKGCEHCRRGYHGRIAFHEVLELDDNIRSAISNEKLEKKDLAKMVYSGNTITMLQDALIKCLEGKTSFEEVYRNIEIENEDDDNYENEIATEIMETIPVDNTVEESDDLLDTSAIQKDENDISNSAIPMSFTVNDFVDNTNAEVGDAVAVAQPEPTPVMAIPTMDIGGAVAATIPTAQSAIVEGQVPGVMQQFVTPEPVLNASGVNYGPGMLPVTPALVDPVQIGTTDPNSNVVSAPVTEVAPITPTVEVAPITPTVEGYTTEVTPSSEAPLEGYTTEVAPSSEAPLEGYTTEVAQEPTIYEETPVVDSNSSVSEATPITEDAYSEQPTIYEEIPSDDTAVEADAPIMSLNDVPEEEAPIMSLNDVPDEESAIPTIDSLGQDNPLNVPLVPTVAVPDSNVDIPALPTVEAEGANPEVILPTVTA